MIRGNEFHGTHTFVGWDMAASGGDHTIYTVCQSRGGELVVVYIGSDGAYAEALAKQLRDNRQMPMLTVISD